MMNKNSKHNVDEVSRKLSRKGVRFGFTTFSGQRQMLIQPEATSNH